MGTGSRIPSPRSSAAIVLSLFLAAGTVQARQQERPGARDTAEERQQRARELFHQGSQLYDQAHYDEAIVRFEEAYRLSARPGLLFNIAQAYRLKGPGFCGTALRYYERHLRDDPAASNRVEIEELMQEMRLCAAAAATAPPPLAAAPAGAVLPGGRGDRPAERPADAGEAGDGPSHLPVWGLVTGSALLLGGAGAYTAARLKYGRVYASGPYPPGTFHNWQIITSASYALMAAGGAVAVVSLAFLLGRGGESRPPAVALAAGYDRGPALRLLARF
jgi:tetratricopeptide (TPR) repeat protein